MVRVAAGISNNFIKLRAVDVVDRICAGFLQNNHIAIIVVFGGCAVDSFRNTLTLSVIDITGCGLGTRVDISDQPVLKFIGEGFRYSDGSALGQTYFSKNNNCCGSN